MHMSSFILELKALFGAIPRYALPAPASSVHSVYSSACLLVSHVHVSRQPLKTAKNQLTFRFYTNSSDVPVSNLCRAGPSAISPETMSPTFKKIRF